MARIGWVDGESFLHKDAELMAEYAFARLAMEDYLAFSLTPLVARTAEKLDPVVEPLRLRCSAAAEHGTARPFPLRSRPE